MTASARPRVSVRGTARRDVAPDSFDVTARLACRAAAAADALAALTDGFARVESAIDALPGADLTVVRGAASQRRSSWYATPGAQPNLEWLASRHVTITGRDVGRVGAVMSAFAELIGSVDGLELDGPTWRLDRDNPAPGELQAEAVREALARAQRYAAALGGVLGPLIELADAGALDHHGARAVPASAGGGISAMDFTPAPIEVSVTVEGRWALILT